MIKVYLVSFLVDIRGVNSMRWTWAIVALASVSVPAFGQDTYVSSTKEYDYLILEDSIRTVREYGDEFTVAWEKHVRPDKSYRMVLTRFWCADVKSNSVMSVEYDAAGKVMKTHDFRAQRSKAYAQDMIPRTIGDTLLRFVCERSR